MKEFKNWPLAIVGLLILLTAGCSALGPTTSPKFNSMVKLANPQGAGETQILGPGLWFPNTHGFNDVRSLALGYPTQPIPGIIVVTTTNLFVEQWNKKDKKYQIIKRFLLAERQDVSLDSYARNRRVVIQWKDYSTDSFSMTTDHGQWIDVPKTEELFKYLALDKNQQK